MKRKSPKFKLSMSHDFRTALWIAMDLLSFVLRDEIHNDTLIRSERISKKLIDADAIADSVIIDFSTMDYLTAVSALEYAVLYLNGIHKHFSTPIMPRIHQELFEYEIVIRVLCNDFLSRKRDTGI